MDREKQLRNEIVRIGRKLYSKGFIAGSDGNISCRLESDSVLITPSGKAKGELGPDDMVVVGTDGTFLRGDSKPSSEYRMHLLLYQRLEHIHAVVHAHPPVITAYSVAGKKIATDILPEGIIMLDKLAWVEYGTPSTDDLSLKMEKYLPESDIFVLANHGATSAGANLDQTYNKLETLEHQARIYLYSTLIGEANSLPPAEVEKIRKLFDVEPI